MFNWLIGLSREALYFVLPSRFLVDPRQTKILLQRMMLVRGFFINSFTAWIGSMNFEIAAIESFMGNIGEFLGLFVMFFGFFPSLDDLMLEIWRNGSVHFIHNRRVKGTDISYIDQTEFSCQNRVFELN